MEQAYYYQYYNFERHHWWFRARAEILKHYIGEQVARGARDLKILNVGVATGSTSEWLANFGHVTSIEYNQECIDFLKTKSDLKVIQGDITDLKFADNSFDLVCSLDVIEHVENDERASSELMRVCKKNGSVVVTVPAHMSLWSDHDIVNHHFRRYTVPEFERLFKKPGGSVEFASYFNTRLYPLISIARKISNMLRKKGQPPHSDLEKFKTGSLDKILYRVFEGEKENIGKKKAGKKGVSIILHWIKSA